MRLKPLLMQLLMGMSMSRYLPPMGMAGLLRDLVRGYRRVPRPPPRTRLRTSPMTDLPMKSLGDPGLSYRAPSGVRKGASPGRAREGTRMNAIREDPDDDAPRLAYADWLEEHGAAERADLLRVQS